MSFATFAQAMPELTPPARLVEQVRALASDTGRNHLRTLSPEDRQQWLIDLQALADAAAAASLVATEVADGEGDAERLAASSTTAWLRSSLRISGAEAADRVHVARASRSLLAGAVESLAAGRTTWQHVRVIDHEVRRVPSERRDEAAAVLTDLAEELSVGDLRTAGRHLGTAVNPDGVLATAHQQFDRRYLTMSRLMDGMTAVDGLLDAEGAALLSAALEPFAVPDGAEDTRTAAQRRADGLLQLVQAACDTASVPLAGGERPHLNVVVDPRRGSTAGQLPSGALLHPLAVARVACDGQLTALLVNDQGVVVDLGRTRRLFSGQQRRLLAARDGGCRWPGCRRPAAHTDAHHVVSWLDGGVTDVANGLLLCRRHHRAVHEGGWSVEFTNHDVGTHGTVDFVGPRNQRLSSSPQGP